MPERKTLQAAKKDKKEGKSAGTQAGEFVREEMHHVRRGKHGARSAKQAIAIGLSKARRAGVKLKAPGEGASATTRRKAAADSAQAKTRRPVSRKRSAATTAALRREGRAAASATALSRQAKAAARKRGPAARSAAAKRAARTRERRGS